MRTPVIKFCGLTRPEDVETALQLGADFLGFVIECNSPRRLSVKQAAALSGPAKGLANRVAVTVDPDNDLIDRIHRQMSPDFIQLHGKENPKRVREIKTRTGAGIFKALSIATASDLRAAERYEGLVDYFLLDAKPPKGAAQRGGHGMAFDWGLLKPFKSRTPLILAGGLTSKTIAAARAETGFNIFDVSSGVEAAPGIKDASLMREFMKAAENE